MPTPPLDLAPITRHLRAKASSNLLVCAVHHLNVFEELATGSLSWEELLKRVGLQERPAMVLFPALLAMEMLEFTEKEELRLTALGTFLTSSSHVTLVGYTGLEKNDPGVLAMTSWLKNDGPENAATGLSYVKDEAADSPMDDPESARFFTLALAGRAKYLSPLVANRMTRRQGHLVDVACGTGYYSYEWLLANPGSTATLFDRPEVLKIAAGLLEEFCRTEREGVETVKQRVHFQPGDMLSDTLPKADILLAASLFHDWPGETCQLLADRFANSLNHGGELWIHDAFLNDSLDGPLPVTDYSALLFLGTRGRAYSKKEYRAWLSAAGLQPRPDYLQTGMDYGLISALKP